MRAVLRFFMLLALVVWVGGIIFFAFVVAPALFSILPARELAGRVVAHSIAALHAMGIVAAVVFVLAATLEARLQPQVRGAGVKIVLVLAMLVLTLASQLGVTPRMERLHSEMGAVDSVAANDPRRAEFDRLHRWSTALESGVLLLGLATLACVARE